MSSRKRNKGETQTCALPSCSRPVSREYKHWPYCKDHYHLSNNNYTLLFDQQYEQATTQKEKDRIYKNKYVPDFTLQTPRESSFEIIQNSIPGIEEAVIKRTSAIWRKSTRGLDMSVPSIAFDKREEILQSVIDKLSKNHDIEIINMEDGTVLFGEGDADLHGKKLLKTDKHRALLLENPKGKYIIDVSTSAPLHNIVKRGESINRYFPSGSTLSDGLNFNNIVEAAFFSDIKWGLITNSEGGAVWDARDKEASDIDEQRRLVHSSPKLERRKIEIYTAKNAEKEDMQNKISQENSESINLEELARADREGRL